MEQQIIDIVTEKLNAEPGSITRETKIADVPNWDSLMQVMILAELEERLHCGIPISKAFGITDVAGLIDAAKGA